MEEEIIDIINDRLDEGQRLNALADEFRCGRDTRELLPLFLSENAEVVSIAAWICGELPVKRYKSAEFVSVLRDLTEHADASVRFHALGAVYPFLGAGDAATRTLLAKLLNDENAGVRMSAHAAAARLGMG